MPGKSTVERAKAELLLKRSRDRERRRRTAHDSPLPAQPSTHGAAAGPPEKPMFDIFVSYAREDRRHAASIAEFLGREGWSVWWDQELTAGARWSDEIAEMLSGCRAVVILWTAQAAQSQWVREEASRASAAGKPILIAYGNKSEPVPAAVGLRDAVPVAGRARLRSGLIAKLGIPDRCSLAPGAALNSLGPAFKDIDESNITEQDLFGNFTIPISNTNLMTNGKLETKSETERQIAEALAAAQSDDPNMRTELMRAMLQRMLRDSDGAGAVEVVAVAGRVRTKMRDEGNGFKARRDAYRKDYRFHEINYERVKSRSDDDFTIVDYLNEEWGDLIDTGELRPRMLIENDFPLYVAIRNYVRGLREGTFGRPPRPEATIEEVLSTRKTSVRHDPPWQRSGEKGINGADGPSRRHRVRRSAPPSP